MMILTLAGEALDVEVVGLDPQHLALALVPTPEAGDDPLLGGRAGVAVILSVQHWRRRRTKTISGVECIM